MAAELRIRLAQQPSSDLQAHAAAVVGPITAILALKVGEIDQAMTDLTDNYPLALTASDMPIIAAVGVSVGWLAAALGREVDAATILGAAARLRGSEDRTDLLIAELTSPLRSKLGPEFDEMFSRGKALDRASPSPGSTRRRSALPRSGSPPEKADQPASGPRPAAVNRAVTAEL